MSFTGIYQFGSITTRNGQIFKLEDLDTDGDGKISQQEFMFIQKELGMDTLELSGEEKKGEKQISDEEYITWAFEMRMSNALNGVISQVATDFIGANAQYSSEIVSELRQFLSDFKAEYKSSGEDLALMADKFEEALPAKYEEIKENILGSEEKKDYEDIQKEWDEYTEAFEKDLKNAGSIDEFVKLNREYLKKHGEYVQKMLASKDIAPDERQSLIQESKTDLAASQQYASLSADGRNMQVATASFIKDLAENCPGWTDLEDNPIIADPDMYMLEYYYYYREHPDPLKDGLSTEYRKTLSQEYSKLLFEYENLVKSGHINENAQVDLSPKKNK